MGFVRKASATLADVRRTDRLRSLVFRCFERLDLISELVDRHYPEIIDGIGRWLGDLVGGRRFRFFGDESRNVNVFFFFNS